LGLGNRIGGELVGKVCVILGQNETLNS